MKQRKVLNVWQMVSLSILLLLMLITMFLPAIQINGNTLKKMNKPLGDLVEEVAKDLNVDGYLKDDMEVITDEAAQQFDEESAKREEESGVKLRNISILRVMGFSTKDLDDGQMKTMIIAFQVLLILSYVLGLIALVMTIVAFAAKLSKLIPLIINIVYAIIVAIVFGFLRFAFAGIIVNNASESILEVVDSMLSEIPGGDIVSLLVSEMDGKTGLSSEFAGCLTDILNCFLGPAILMMFIVAILVLVLSIVSMFVGNKVAVAGYDDNTSYGADPFGGNAYGADNPFAMAGNVVSGVNPFAEDSNSTPDRNPFDSDSSSFGNGSFPDEIPVTMAEPAVESPAMPVEPMVPPVPDTPVMPISSVAQASSVMPTPPVAQASSVMPKPAVTPVTANRMGSVLCTKGVAAGQGFQLPANRMVVVGKSPQKANLVVNNQHVSNVHCSITYNAGNNTYRVTDHSMNGTYVNGVRLQKELVTSCPPGTVLSLADGSVEIALG